MTENKITKLIKSKFSTANFFLKHLKNKNKAKNLGSFLLFIFGYIFLFKHLPIFGKLSRALHSLLKGYKSEIEWAKQNQIEYKLPNSTITHQTTQTTNEIFDYVIIGSGPGAASAYSNLPKMSKVLLIESGMHLRTPENLNHSLLSLQLDYKDHGGEFILCHGFPQFAQARVFGGGSEINSGLYHDLPEQLLQKFSDSSGVSTDQWLNAQRKTRESLNLNTTSIDFENSLIARGAKSLNLEFQNIARWRQMNTEHIVHFGMKKLYWEEAVANFGLKIKLNLTIKKINNTQKSFLEIIGFDENNEKCIIKCKNAIISAGTIDTPKILYSSNLINRSDIKFQWHPMVRAIVETKESDLGFLEIDPVQAWTSDKKIKFGSGVGTPGLLSAGLNRELSTADAVKFRSYYASYKSSGIGGIFPKLGIPWYKYNETDFLMEEESKNLLEHLIDFGGGTIIPDSQGKKFKTSTVHIFGSLPIDSKIFIKGSSKLKCDQRIQVSDASLLPEAPGVNPQGITMTLCRLVTSG